jgi:hypothetical protein
MCELLFCLLLYKCANSSLAAEKNGLVFRPCGQVLSGHWARNVSLTFQHCLLTPCLTATSPWYPFSNSVYSSSFSKRLFCLLFGLLFLSTFRPAGVLWLLRPWIIVLASFLVGCSIPLCLDCAAVMTSTCLESSSDRWPPGSLTHLWIIALGIVLFWISLAIYRQQALWHLPWNTSLPGSHSGNPASTFFTIT